MPDMSFCAAFGIRLRHRHICSPEWLESPLLGRAGEGASTGFRTIEDGLLQALDVVAGDSVGEGERGGQMDGHPDLVDCQIRVRGDDGAPREVHPFARQVPPEAALFALQPLHKPPAAPQCQSFLAMNPSSYRAASQSHPEYLPAGSGDPLYKVGQLAAHQQLLVTQCHSRHRSSGANSSTSSMKLPGVLAWGADVLQHRMSSRRPYPGG